jgi:environmental stress-induced protein Ves
VYKIIRENEFISTQWSGGTTNQMYITPSDATISKQDFLIRISTATINTLTSEFTKFPFHYRFLSILNGEIEFKTGVKTPKKIAETEFDFFDGADTTISSSKSQVVDFNIIYSKQLYLNIEQYTDKQSKTLRYLTSGQTFIFIAKGSIELNKIELNENELIILEETNQEINIELSVDAVLFLFNFSNLDTDSSN